jgi:hypothetical protein
MTRFAWKWLALALALVVGGCAGELNDPDAFIGEPGGGAKDAETILAESCTSVGCHDDSANPAMGLNLLSPGVADRVVDVEATGFVCGNTVLVVAGDPEGSHLLDKVLGICGTQMPPLPLEADEIDTLRQWIVDLGGS